MKKILIISYSQTGQLNRVIASVLKPLKMEKDVHVFHQILEPDPDYPFPWPFWKFIDVFPESSLMIPPKLKPLSEKIKDDFDLIIIAYTVWYLAPSPPITAFLKSVEARQILNQKPVITLIVCRNMWLMAQEKVKTLLENAKAVLIDNVVLTEEDHQIASFITTPRWMFTGKKNRFFGIFPPAGISEEKIQQAVRFGHAIKNALKTDALKNKKPILKGLQAVRVNPRYITSEKIGNALFTKWAKLLIQKGAPGKRQISLIVFFLFLITLIITVVPFTLLLKLIFSPFIQKRMLKEKNAFEQPSGSETCSGGACTI